MAVAKVNTKRVNNRLRRQRRQATTPDTGDGEVDASTQASQPSKPAQPTQPAFKILSIVKAPITQEVIDAAADLMRILKVGL